MTAPPSLPRVAVPSADDVRALPMIARQSAIPVIADIHFQPKYVFAAIDASCAGVRVNPGNIKAFDEKVGEIGAAASAAGVPIRIGVNAGSLDRRLLAKYGRVTAEALVESALWECHLFEEHGFTDLKISVKHHDPVVQVTLHQGAARRLRRAAVRRELRSTVYWLSLDPPMRVFEGAGRNVRMPLRAGRIGLV